MKDFSNFITKYRGAIIGVIIAIILLATKLYNVIIGIFNYFSMWFCWKLYSKQQRGC